MPPLHNFPREYCYVALINHSKDTMVEEGQDKPKLMKLCKRFILIPILKETAGS
jgi:hypothetical protein